MNGPQGERRQTKRVESAETAEVTMPAVLSVENLTVEYRGGLRAVDGVDLRITAGRTLALVGESGCGKSTIARTLLGLHDQATRVGGRITLTTNGETHELVGMKASRWKSIRGRHIGYVAQDPFGACNPTHSVRRHVEESRRARRVRPNRDTTVALLTSLGIDDARRRSDERPFQWSGGMLQRATIAAATSGRAAASRPALVVADEPTSALDTDRADMTLDLLRERSDAVLLISHDLALVARHADDVAIIYAGRIVEVGNAAIVLATPRHPYTQALLAATPRPGFGLPTPLPGAAPRLGDPIAGCAFASRCALAEPSCWVDRPELIDDVACPVFIRDREVNS